MKLYDRGLDALSAVAKAPTIIGGDEAEFISQEMKKPLWVFGLIVATVVGYAIYSEFAG